MNPCIKCEPNATCPRSCVGLSSMTGGQLIANLSKKHMAQTDLLQQLYSEVDCRIEHGAESNGHLEYVRSTLGKILGMAEI